jgi:hypothetical protein
MMFAITTIEEASQISKTVWDGIDGQILQPGPTGRLSLDLV